MISVETASLARDDADPPPRFFWLHIKKSAGSTTRQLLAPEYAETDRKKFPATFIQLPVRYHNDILNNYRIPLGAYQFRRMQFAHLYLPWAAEVPSLAISRDPVGRCVSAFHYLWHQSDGRAFLRQRLDLAARGWRLRFGIGYSFDCYLDTLEAARQSDSMFRPRNLHFRAHTAPMWDDIVDETDRILVSHVIRIDRLFDALDDFLETCGIGRRVDRSIRWRNVRRGTTYVPTAEQKRRIAQIYARDFDIYEGVAT